MKRKRRSDRRQLIYKITCKVTGEIYIGLTVLNGGWKKTLKARFARHVGRAILHPELNWNLCNCIRDHKLSDFVVDCLAIIKGKAEAHLFETALIDELEPSLNTFKKGFDKLKK